MHEQSSVLSYDQVLKFNVSDNLKWKEYVDAIASRLYFLK